MRQKYKDNMTADEVAALMAELQFIDDCYKSIPLETPAPEEWEDETETLHRAALNRGQP